MSPTPRRPAFVWLVLLLCGVYTGFFAFTAYVSARSYGTFKNPGWTARPDDIGWVVTNVDAAGAAAGRLERGDRLLAINGDVRAAVLGTSTFVNVRRDETYRVDLDRHGQRVSVDLRSPLAVRSSAISPRSGASSARRGRRRGPITATSRASTTAAPSAPAEPI